MSDRKESAVDAVLAGTASSLPPTVTEAKEFLALEHAKLREQHESGSPGIQVSNRLSDAWDSVLTRILEGILVDLSQGMPADLPMTLVAVGGYGRRDVAPFSDMDLMLLHRNEGPVEAVAQRLATDIADAGLTLGFAVRTSAQACADAQRDATIFTSLVESRWVAGNEALLANFMHRFRRRSRRGRRSNITRIEQARRDERAQYGETVFLLEPNVKRSVGGLRDIHLLRWVGFARYGEANPEALRLGGWLSREDERTLRRALRFLLRLRNELHFHVGRPYDVLYRAEQMRIAEKWGYPGTSSVLPVEQFMSDYFLHTQNVKSIVRHFRSSARRRTAVTTLLTPLISHRMEGRFLVGPYHLSVTAAGRRKLRGNLGEILHMMDLANQLGKRIDHDTWMSIREDMQEVDEMEVTPEVARRFMSLLSYTASLGDLLRGLHELRVLEKLVAGMAHARHLLQFNRYHKYTVDEHSILAVESAVRFQDEKNVLGKVYRRIVQKEILHLALLIHDLGKGLPGDHSDVGGELAQQTAARLRLGRQESELLEFLVRKHLIMSHLAFRRDTSDESIIIQFAGEVGSQVHLDMLFVLTAADLAAVGPGVLNPWKQEILTDVYQRTRFHLDGTSADSDSVVLRINEQRNALLKQAPSEGFQWFEAQVAALDGSYLEERSTTEILHDLDRLRAITPDQAVAWGRYLPERRVTEYSIGLDDTHKPGIFHRLTGALAANGLTILSASIQTLAEGLIFDRFTVNDTDFDGEPPPERLESVGQALVDAVQKPPDSRPVFRSTWRGQRRDGDHLTQMPTRVLADNQSLPDCTIIDVFTHDRPGLLYAIARRIYELNLSVRFAKIGTYLDQVVDVFYVTDLSGNKVKDADRVQHIRDELLRAIDTSAANPDPSLPEESL